MAGYLNLEDVSVEFHYWILHVWADARKLIKSEQAENAIYYEFLEKMVNRLLEVRPSANWCATVAHRCRNRRHLRLRIAPAHRQSFTPL
jgi:hypothetical protein